MNSLPAFSSYAVTCGPSKIVSETIRSAFDCNVARPSVCNAIRYRRYTALVSAACHQAKLPQRELQRFVPRQLAQRNTQRAETE